MKSVFLGFECNNHCGFCSQGSLGDVKTGAADSGELPKSKELAFVGGEPTLSSKLPDLIRRAKRDGAQWVLLQTNGRRLCYSDYAQELKGAGLDALDVSLHGSTAAMHDYHTEVPGSFAQTAAGLENAKKAGFAVGVSTVVTRSNFRHLLELVHVARRCGAQAVRFELAAAYGRAALARDRVVPAAELVADHVVPASREALRLGLGLVVFGKASSPAARRLFAGLGERNEAHVAPERPKLVLAGQAKANPGLNERRGSEKVTGDALRAIFPGLFEAATRPEASHG